MGKGGWTEQREGKNRTGGRIDRGKAGRQRDGGEEVGMGRRMEEERDEGVDRQKEMKEGGK